MNFFAKYQKRKKKYFGLNDKFQIINAEHRV